MLSMALVMPATADDGGAGDHRADAAFFEFLAELEKLDDEWIDPMQLPPVEQTTQEKQNDED